MKKVLIIRLSSIGDIVLTTPLVRCLKEQAVDIELHFITRKSFLPVLADNPYIDKIYTVEKKPTEVLDNLKAEHYDFVIDLHKNIRSSRLKRKLQVRSATFDKLNYKKWLAVNLNINKLPDIHIVDRYFQAASDFNITNDQKGLDYFIPDKDHVSLNFLPEHFQSGFIGFVVGGKHNTKILPIEKVVSLCKAMPLPVVLLGGKEDKRRAKDIVVKCEGRVFSACGYYNINQSASILDQAKLIITNDTGLMHIAAARKKKIISIWGNTIPEFGMYQYLPAMEKSDLMIAEVHGLRCRPCSKIGYQKCPRKHFDCMMKIDEKQIIAWVEQALA